jgi:pyruvate ferredoxin oxidoreductase beta subunit/2-oxoisovalerate ferredoxin oxidoreductase beta subunit
VARAETIGNLPARELLGAGHLACQGCGAALAMRLVLKALGPRTVAVLPASCWSVINGPMLSSAVGVPLLHAAFEAAAAVASGVRAGLTLRGLDDVTVMAWAGDGGTFDIGLQALSGAAERDEDFLYVCYDNEAYMNTGIQCSGATPWGAWTSTTPAPRGNITRKKDIVAILAAHRIPYAATASVAFPADLHAKVQRAAGVRGTRFLHLLSPCPPGWRADPDQTVRLARLAVEARVFPLYEVWGGTDYRITHRPRGVPVADYLRGQGRFAHLGPDEVGRIQAEVDAHWERLLARCASTPRGSLPHSSPRRKEGTGEGAGLPGTKRASGTGTGTGTKEQGRRGEP